MNTENNVEHVIHVSNRHANRRAVLCRYLYNRLSTGTVKEQTVKIGNTDYDYRITKTDDGALLSFDNEDAATVCLMAWHALLEKTGVYYRKHLVYPTIPWPKSSEFLLTFY